MKELETIVERTGKLRLADEAIGTIIHCLEQEVKDGKLETYKLEETDHSLQKANSINYPCILKDPKTDDHYVLNFSEHYSRYLDSDMASTSCSPSSYTVNHSKEIVIERTTKQYRFSDAKANKDTIRIPEERISGVFRLYYNSSNVGYQNHRKIYVKDDMDKPIDRLFRELLKVV